MGINLLEPMTHMRPVYVSTLTSLCLSNRGLVFNITFLAVTHYQLLGQARGEVERGVFKKYQFTREHHLIFLKI